MKDVVLRVDKLSKTFAGICAVRDVSFSLFRGERVALIGPNGAGKSTLFGLITGESSPSSGKVYLFGEDVTDLPAFKRVHLGIGRSFQITKLFFNLTVFDNALIAVNGRRKQRFSMMKLATKDSELVSEVENLLKAVNFWGRRNEYVKNLSYGEQRKLEVAFALWTKPKLLLLDEPNCGLTSDENREVLNMLDELLGKDVTILLVAHDMDLVFGFAERIIVLHYGEIVAMGSAEGIKKNPKVEEIYVGECL